MIKEELKSLFQLDVSIYSNNHIDNLLLYELDEFILNNYNSENISQEAIIIYKKFQPMKQHAPNSMKTVLFSTMRNYALDEGQNNKPISELLLYRFLLVKSELIAQDFLNIAKAIYKIDNKCDKFVCKWLNIYEIKENQKALLYIELGDFYKTLNYYKKAIDCYEKFLEIDKTKSVVYNITADLYSKYNGDKSIERQIELYKSALNLQPENRLATHCLAFIYERLGDNIQAKKYYKKLLKNNPKINDLYNYGGFLIHCGDFENGHKYFRYRFQVDDKNLYYPVNDNPEKRWNLSDNISDKTLLIHYEQGYGDTIMYSRFVPFMDSFAKKIKFVVQDPLYNLIKNSYIFKNIEIISDSVNLDGIDYDYSMALLDCPYVLKTKSTNIAYADGYLDIDAILVQDYKRQYLNNEKFKIGISAKGDVNANYTSRDINLSQFKFLKELPNTELYSLQKDTDCDFLIPLGNTFRNFTDSACAVKNMDLIITTDNVILNLAGALGVKTLALFNKQTNFRWFQTIGENVGYYSSVKPFQNDIQDDWTSTLQLLNNYIHSLSEFL